MARRPAAPAQDEGTANIAHVIGTIAFTATILIPSIIMIQPQLGNTALDVQALEQINHDLENALDLLNDPNLDAPAWTDPAGRASVPDPTAASPITDLATRSIATTEDPVLEETLDPFLPAGAASELTLTYTPLDPDDPTLHTVTTHRQGPQPDGPVAGRQRLTPVPEHAPAYVLPRLDKIPGTTNLDLHFVPLSKYTNYQAGLLDAHTHHLETKITYTRTARGDDLDGTSTIEIQRSGHTELTGARTPNLQLHFTEPDWTAIAEKYLGNDVDLEPPAVEDLARTFSQVLTTEDLETERALTTTEEPDDGLLGDDPLDPNATEPYPQHGFELSVNLTGPGWVTTTKLDPESEAGTRMTTSDAYKLTIEIPRNWTDVDTTQSDNQTNSDAGWRQTEITPLPGHAGHRITSYLVVNGSYQEHTNEDSVDWGLISIEDGVVAQAPFRFHARPPAQDAASELGFQHVTARLESLSFQVHASAALTVETTNNLGRVHRTIQTTTPQTIPVTPRLDDGQPTGITMPIGAVFVNGGEDTRIPRVVFTAREGTFIHRIATPASPSELEAFANGSWTISDDGAKLIWRSEDVDGGLCPRLTACAIAASVRADGRGLGSQGLRAPPHVAGLYEPADANAYLTWFVENDWAERGIPASTARNPGFARATVSQSPRPSGQAGASTFTLPPSADPICGQADLDDRNQANRAGTREDGSILYEIGPNGDGYPRAGSATECALDAAWEGEPEQNYTLIAHTGSSTSVRGVSAIGRAGYEVIPGLPSDAFSEWQNGLAESWIVAPSEPVPAGGSGTFEVHADGFFDALLATSEAEIDLTYRVLDPHNAWEDLAWLDGVIAEDVTVELSDPTGDPPEVKCDGVQCQIEREDPIQGPVGSKEGFPGRFDLTIDTDRDTLLGTHLLVIEVSWRTSVPGGAGVNETGRLIAPFDVVDPQGEPRMLASVGVTAWLPDWT